MQGMGDGNCPYQFNFEPETFKVGDLISYRVPSLGDFPFVAEIMAVHDDYIEIMSPDDPEKWMRATREARPVVSDEEALG
ncbi:hypothetical protein [Halioxenophilus sp. WMMB6]|uniref:hypothetical protein n=1 Tax=Halioxenophilus sp. WMMB6 TaxID=3073815 RepID=UPI00295E74A1|nr:hypothetical protein [Halioxenophilus sp. WMMB6]